MRSPTLGMRSRGAILDTRALGKTSSAFGNAIQPRGYVPEAPGFAQFRDGNALLASGSPPNAPGKKLSDPGRQKTESDCFPGWHPRREDAGRSLYVRRHPGRADKLNLGKKIAFVSRVVQGCRIRELNKAGPTGRETLAQG